MGQPYIASLHQPQVTSPATQTYARHPTSSCQCQTSMPCSTFQLDANESLTAELPQTPHFLDQNLHSLSRLTTSHPIVASWTWRLFVTIVAVQQPGYFVASDADVV